MPRIYRSPSPRARLPRAGARLCLAFLLTLHLPTALGAQSDVRPELDWRTIRTRYFDIHYPAPAERWTRSVAERLDAVRDSVAAVVGYAPERRVTVIVEDPENRSNGFALPFLRGPVIMLWPTPVAPPHVLANNRAWGDVLAVHEYAHIAHLTRPSRNARQRALWSLLPVELGPLTRRSPRWLYEGYATWVEGWLTGSGRPNAAWRAAILRQWAIEGRLPGYGQLDGSSTFLGGNMAYLAGSAFLEWIDRAAQDDASIGGDGQAPGESLQRLWRRMSARVDRGFVDAFRGTYGESPAWWYGRFTAELTARAIALRDALITSDPQDATRVQRFHWGTSDPAVSPDGTRLALVRRERERPGRLVVIDVGPDADTAAVRKLAEAETRLLERDPDDIPALSPYPLPRKELHVLPAVDGRVAERPRFLPDGESILFARLEPTGDGALRWDLSIWNLRDGRVRRVTHGAGVREADPAPNGREAVGVRCEWGICDLVRVDLATGRLTTIRAGAPDVQYAGPRVAPDGRVAVAEQRDGRWRILLLEPSGEARVVAPDDAPRYTPAFSPDGRFLVVTSERGGIPHVERIDLETLQPELLSRGSGAHFSPTVAPDGRVFFLSLHATGHDLYAVDLGAARGEPFPVFDPRFGGRPPEALAPAAPSRFGRPVAFDTSEVVSSPYRTTPGRPILLPGGGHAADGGLVTLLLATSDPIGRLGVTLEGGGGARSTWAGGWLAAAWRRWPVHVEGNLGLARGEPSRQPRPLAAPTAGGLLDTELRSGTLALAWHRRAGFDALALRAGGSLGRVERLPDEHAAARQLAFAEARLTNTVARDVRTFSQSLSLEGASGRTDGARWTRGSVTGELAAGIPRAGIAIGARLGAVSGDAPVWEHFAVGGTAPRFADPASLAQRVPVPALPAGTLVGDRLFLWRVETRIGFPAGVRPYLLSVSVDRDFEDWQRVAGLEWRGSFERVPYVRLPNVTAEVGWGRRLTTPDKGRDTFYLGVRYRP